MGKVRREDVHCFDAEVREVVPGLVWIDSHATMKREEASAEVDMESERVWEG